MIERKFHKYSATFNEKLVLFEGIEDMTPVEITLPAPPPLKDIEGYNRSQSMQMWWRKPLPPNFHKWDNVRKRGYIDEEWRRITHGHYFMNNGKIVYLSGAHYMYLKWWRTKEFGFPQFWMSDHDYFHYWEWVKKNDKCVGMIDIENRQGGKTAKAAFLLYYEVFRDFRVRGGMQSKTDKDADKFFRNDILYAWRNLPYFFQPKFDNSDDPTDALYFKNPTRRGEAAKALMMDWDSQMKILEQEPRKAQMFSQVDYASSTANAYDSATLKIYVRDEFGKMAGDDVDIFDSWGFVKPSLINQNTKKPRGKAIYTSTIEFMEKKGGQRAKELWNQSGIEGTTMLMQYFLPDFKARFRDQYGIADEEKANQIWEQEYNRLPPNERASYRRKHPRNLRDAFAITSEQSHFNTYNLNRVLEHYAPYYISTKNEPYIWKVTADCPTTIQGNFEWTIKDQQVQFFPDENGRYIVSYLFENPAYANRMGFDGVGRYPLNTNFGVAGCDTFSKSLHGEKKTKDHSDGSVCVYRKFDRMYDEEGVVPVIDDGKILRVNHKTDTFCCTYRFRQPTVEEFYEDVLKVCVYYGVQVFPETNVRGINEYILNRGFGGYLYYPYNPKTQKLQTEAGSSTQTKTFAQLMNLWRTYIQVNGLRERHRELIHELSEIDDAPNKFDRFIAGGYALMAAQKDEMMNKPVQFADLDDYLYEGQVV